MRVVLVAANGRYGAERCVGPGLITRGRTGRGVRDERRCHGVRAQAGVAVAVVESGLCGGLARQWRPVVQEPPPFRLRRQTGADLIAARWNLLA